MNRPQKPVDESALAGKVGARIKVQRLKKRLSVLEAAGHAGVSATMWNSWEDGRRLPLDRLPAIAAALGCSVRSLMPPG